MKDGDFWLKKNLMRFPSFGGTLETLFFCTVFVYVKLNKRYFQAIVFLQEHYLVDIQSSSLILMVGHPVIMFKETHFIDCIAREMLHNMCCLRVCPFPLPFGLAQDFTSLWISIFIL